MKVNVSRNNGQYILISMVDINMYSDVLDQIKVLDLLYFLLSTSGEKYIICMDISSSFEIVDKDSFDKARSIVCNLPGIFEEYNVIKNGEVCARRFSALVKSGKFDPKELISIIKLYRFSYMLDPHGDLDWIRFIDESRKWRISGVQSFKRWRGLSNYRVQFDSEHGVISLEIPTENDTLKKEILNIFDSCGDS